MHGSNDHCQDLLNIHLSDLFINRVIRTSRACGELLTGNPRIVESLFYLHRKAPLFNPEHGMMMPKLSLRENSTTRAHQGRFLSLRPLRRPNGCFHELHRTRSSHQHRGHGESGRDEDEYDLAMNAISNRDWRVGSGWVICKMPGRESLFFGRPSERPLGMDADASSLENHKAC